MKYNSAKNQETEDLERKEKFSIQSEAYLATRPKI